MPVESARPWLAFLSRGATWGAAWGVGAGSLEAVWHVATWSLPATPATAAGFVARAVLHGAAFFAVWTVTIGACSLLFAPARSSVADDRRVGGNPILAGSLVAGTVEAMVRTMTERLCCDLDDLWAGIGPTIGLCCYEVGPEVVAAVEAACPPGANVVRNTGGRTCLDIPTAVQAQLRAIGVEQVEDAGLCTACQVGEFFSHRAEHGRTGRFGVVMELLE